MFITFLFKLEQITVRVCYSLFLQNKFLDYNPFNKLNNGMKIFYSLGKGVGTLTYYDNLKINSVWLYKKKCDYNSETKNGHLP